MNQHKEQQGFLTVAINTDTVDYLNLAYLQCLNVKATQQQNQFAVVVDQATFDSMSDKQLNTFDHVLNIGNIDIVNPFALEPLAFRITPFKETIKLESDLLFTRSIDHWWTAFRLRDMCLPVGALTYQNQPGTVRKYRELFDLNHLPDVYNGLMYFRYTQTAQTFFSIATDIFTNWQTIQQQLKNCDIVPTTDVVYAIAALVIGDELVTMPSMNFLNFVHMKSGFNGWSDNRSWIDTVMTELDGDMIRINNLNQLSPVHYYDKTFATTELIKYHESRTS